MEKLQSVLSATEIISVPETSRTKLEEHLVELHQLINDLKNDNAELSAISERQKFQFDREVFECKTQLQESSETCSKLKTENVEHSENLSSLQKQLKELQHAHDLAEMELHSLKKSNELLLEEKQQLVSQLEKRSADIEKLNGDLKIYADQTTQLSEEKHAAIAKVELAQMHESTLQHHVNRLEKEKSLLEQQISDMGIELKQKNHEIHTLKREKSTTVLELQSQLEQKIDEVTLLQQQVTSLKEINEEKDKRIESLAEKIRNLNETHQQMDEQLQLELDSQKKLVELFKNASETNQERIHELVGAFEETQKVLQESVEAKNEAVCNLEKAEEEHKLKLEEVRKGMDKLKEELKHANDLVQGKAFSPEIVESLFPTAAATSKVMRSGMTLTQMYSQYIKAQEEIQNLKNENVKMSEQLEQIVSEIQENTPIINQKMQEYHKAMETITSLRTQLTSSVTDYEMLQSERNDSKRAIEHLKRENSRLKIAMADSNKQVQVLLKEISEARGGFVRTSDTQIEEEVSSTDDITADKVITKHLVTFRDIVELQTKNQKLIAVVRDLSEQQEKLEKTLTDQKNDELQSELKNALLQLEELQKNRLKQADLIKSIVRQRDMYRVLLSTHGVSDSMLGSPPGSPALSSTKLNVAVSPGDQSSRNALLQLQSDFITYKKEKAENDKLQNEQLDKLRNQLSDAHIENAKLSSQLEFSDEKLNLLQSNMENYRKEATFLRDKNQKHTTLLTQHQQTIHILQEQLMELREKSTKNEVLVENLKAERDLLRGVEQRLINEKESIFREQQQKGQVLAHLQAVQNNLERLESESKRNLQYQIEKMEKENALLKVQVGSNSEEYRSAVKVWEKQTKELRNKLDAEIANNRKLHGELVDSYSKLHSANQELQVAKAVSPPAGPSKAPTKICRVGPQQTAAVELRTLRQQLTEAQESNKALKEQLELAQRSVECYSTMSSDLEMKLKEQDEISQHLKDSMQSAFESNDDVKKDLEQSLEKMEKSYHDLIEENMKLVQDRDTKMQELHAQVNKLQHEIDANKSTVETAAKTASEAREVCNTQTNLMKETQEKYERELVLHAEDIQALTKLKEEHMKCTEKMEHLSKAAIQAKLALQEQSESWTEQERLLISEHEALKKRAVDLQTQNENLLHQLELLGTKIAAIQSKDWDNVPSAADTKETQHLIEVIRFLKREKEIINTQFDAAQSERIRFKLKTEQMEGDLAEAKKEIQELQNITQTNAQTQAQHVELLRKIEMMSLLTESNSLLRIEKENLLKANSELEGKLQALEKEMQPMSESQKQLRSQLESVTQANVALRVDVRSWQSRTNQLLEQSHRIGPLEYKNLIREVEELKSQKGRLAEEMQRKQTEVSQLNTNIVSLNRELQGSRTEANQQKQAVAELMTKNEEQHKTIQTVQKIGRKYRNQYEEVKSLYDALIAKNKASETAAAQEQETQKKLDESEKRATSLQEENEKIRETLSKTETTLKDADDKEEKTKKLLSKLRATLLDLKNEKDGIARERSNMQKELEESKKKIATMTQTIEEENARNATVKSHADAKLQQLERSLKSSKETIEQLEKELSMKMTQQKQATKPTAVGGIVERGSGAFEPLTANIKPLSSPQSLGAGLRHTTHAAVPSPRSTPTASIRPMAIGAVSASNSPQTRMALILPTTASACQITTTTSGEEEIPVVTVQPIPVTATVTPTAATVMPLTHTISVDVQNPPSIEVVQPTHNVALVGPRVEGSDSTEAVNAESPAPTASVIVSPPTTQTHLVQPTLKRPRDENQGLFEGSEAGPSAQKKVRTVSEGSQTSQHAALPSATQPNVVTFAVETSKTETASSEVIPDSLSEAKELMPVITLHQTPSADNDVEVIEVASDTEKYEEEDSDVLEIEDKDDQIGDTCIIDQWEDDDDLKAEGDGEIEEMVSEDETADQMEEIEDTTQEMPGISFQTRGDDEDMGDDDTEIEEMGDQSTDACVAVIDVLDNSPEHEMEADSSSLQPTPAEQCMAPPAFPIATTTDTASEGLTGQSSGSIQIRRPIAQRIPIRHSTSARQSLPPFAISGQGPSYEEGGDDSIVPSTPTLFLPRRSDGFAEAVSSPQVPPGRFLFSSSDSSPTQQGMSQLASQGGVDDTRMDLSQFDDGGNRTVPSTPIQVSPPVLAEASEPDIVIEQSIEHEIEGSIIPPIIVIDPPDSEDPDVCEKKEMGASTPQLSVTTSEVPKIETESTKKEELLSSESGIESSLSSIEQASSVSGDMKKEPENVDTTQTQTTPSTQSQRKPIVWEKNPANPSTSSITTSSLLPTPPTTSGSQFHPPIVGSGETIRPPTRARRLNLRGTPSARSRGRGSTYWTPVHSPRGGRARRAERARRGGNVF